MVPPLPSFKNKKIFLITHVGCDVDAIGAAGALYFALKEKNSAEILVPDHISLPAMRFAKRAGVPYTVVQGKSLKKAGCLFMVDFNSLSLAGSMASQIKRFKGEKFLLDHHTRGGKGLAPEKNSMVKPNAVASCELVFDLMERDRVLLTKKTAACIAAGITADSANFLTANSKTFRIMGEVLEKSGKTFSQLVSMFAVEAAFDEKLALLKAAARSRFFRVGNKVVAASEIGAFEANAAAMLVKIGADIAFAGDAEEGKLRISGRASQRVVQKEGFDLAKHVFQRLPRFFQGSGGGHAGAAAFHGAGKEAQPALSKCVQLAGEFFRKRNPGVEVKEYT